MKNLTTRLVLYINYFFAFLLGLAYLNPFIDASIFWVTAFLGIVFPYLVIANFLFVVFWGLVKSNKIFISLLLLIAGYSYYPSMIQFNLAGGGKPSVKSSIKVMSYNVRLFDLYGWRKEKETKNDIMNLVLEENADIVCFQEFFYSDDKSYYKTLETIKEIPKTKYEHIQDIEWDTRKKHHWGIATFSKYPIFNKGQVRFDNQGNDLCIYSDIVIETDTIRVYNLHLASVGLKREDYAFLDKLNDTDNQEQIKGLTTISLRIKDAFARRSGQAKKIKEHMDKCNYHTLVCGDFNDTPFSYVFNTIANDMMDSFENGGQLMGPTYIGKFPSVRIDFILHSNQIKSDNYNRINKEYSDHYPITTYLSFQKETNL
ncbi:MAG: endonuclease/exonuclease/phosphatase family protein [Flavobacteriales bacterium]|nr:endonuclease/exonuclease/phosphatase family protein [Flavobacteriales bacterium]